MRPAAREQRGEIRAVTCYVIECADCGPACWGEDGWYFESEDELRRCLARDGWTRERHGRWLCEECTRRADCARAGRHAWSRWRPHYFDNAVALRDCEHCDTAEETLVALLTSGRERGIG